MKIDFHHIQSFKGHSAGKIKALYMQNASLPAQILLYDELREIGKRHNFDVFIHNNDRLYNEEMNDTADEDCNYQLWAQDNKTILNKGGEKVVISSTSTH